MAIEHKDIPDGQRHEPKGISTALLNSTYVATGSGTGAWKKIGVEALRGVTDDGGVAGRYYVSDGANGWVYKIHACYVQGGWTNNSTAFTSAASSDASLQTVTAYAALTGTGAPWANDLAYAGTQTGEKFYAPVTGVYRFDFDVNVLSVPTSTSKLGFRAKINGISFAPRSVISRFPSASLPMNVHGSVLVTLNAGEYVQLTMACTDAGSVVLSDVTATMDLRRQV